MSKNNTKPRGYWTKEKCHEVALLCNTKKEFNLLNSSAYAISKNNKWIDEICSHMIQIQII